MRFHDQFTLKSLEGVNYKRHLSHVKKYDSGESSSPDSSIPENGVEPQLNEGEVPEVGQTPKPVRSRKIPSRYKDFVTKLG